MLRKGCSVVLGQVFHTPDLLSSANLQVDAAGSALEPSRPRWCWEGPPRGLVLVQLTPFHFQQTAGSALGPSRLVQAQQAQVVMEGPK